MENKNTIWIHEYIKIEWIELSLIRNIFTSLSLFVNCLQSHQCIPQAVLCSPPQGGMFIGHLRQLFARLPLILTLLLLNWGGRQPVRKLSSKNKVLHGLLNLCPYVMGIRPVNPP